MPTSSEAKSTMKLTSQITPYDPGWADQYQKEARRLRTVFEQDLLDMHHVGSTAVRGLAAKPEIDILIIVASGTLLSTWTRALAGLGYQRGGDLSEGHHFFKRNHNGVRTHKLHVIVSGHPMIDRLLIIRDHLRCNPDDRNAYQALKTQLEQENKTGIAEYLRGKEPFLNTLYDSLCHRTG